MLAICGPYQRRYSDRTEILDCAGSYLPLAYVE
jgi:hypothetical protein